MKTNPFTPAITMLHSRHFLSTFVFTIATTGSALADAPRLTLPIDCKLGVTCFLQNYVDIVPGKQTGDYACGGQTYDGHKGTDFRVLSALSTAQQPVAVLAAAPGTVKAVRDGMADKLMTKRDDPAIKRRECGNGLVIDHGGGWETQYCHLKRGSLSVRKGDKVQPGDRLGAVGYSGAAQFAHVHLAVRHNGKTIDPFLAKGPGSTCRNTTEKPTNAKPEDTLWHPAVAKALVYHRGRLLTQGFTGAPVTTAQLEQAPPAPLSTTSPVLLYYARFINLLKGDTIRLQLTGPSGMKLDNTTSPLDRHKATYVAYVGKKRRASQWPTGSYTGHISLIRNGQAMLNESVQFQLK